jgi:hypothetical protein
VIPVSMMLLFQLMMDIVMSSALEMGLKSVEVTMP